MEPNIKRFQDFFAEATRSPWEPYPYQTELSLRAEWPVMLDVPTGLGKTAAIVLGWLFRRQDDALRSVTPRRLVYCLPMRTLVEQTVGEARRWIENLALADRVGVQVLMGGIEVDRWDEHPDRDQILIGTQDMLLSRALNRGYAMSRFRWPVPFSLLNNDCQWVLDETQLMGVGVSTAAQLQGLRERLGAYGPTRTLWASATLDAESVWTVDHPQPTGEFVLRLSEDERELPPIKQRLHAAKPLEMASVSLSKDGLKSKRYEKSVAAEIRASHRPGTLTLAVFNTVDRAREVFEQLRTLNQKSEDAPGVALIHSRYRGIDREAQQSVLLRPEDQDADGPGRIVIATQTVEAGVDVSAATLWTELAPWPSLVQRFGRCNRRGEYPSESDEKISARVLWIDIDTGDSKPTNEVASYTKFELDESRKRLGELSDVGLATLEGVDYKPIIEPVPHLRRKDLLDLCDTTPALSGHDIDVSRFIRDGDDVDLRFYWRDWDGAAKNAAPPKDIKSYRTPIREELCAVRLVAAKQFLKPSKSRKPTGWQWNHLTRGWESVGHADLTPGMTVLLPEAVGGYDGELGWTGNPKTKFSGKDITIDEPEQTAVDHEDTTTGDDPDSVAAEISLAMHTNRVVQSVENIQNALKELAIPPVIWERLHTAIQYHDWGKAHEAFQRMLRGGTREDLPETLLAKSQPSLTTNGKTTRRTSPQYIVNGSDGQPMFRGYFRHELASALAYLQYRGHSDDVETNLVAYLIAAHHGKVRASLRSLPNESRPPDKKTRFARGVWHGDELPAATLCDGVHVEPIALDLRVMSLGGESEDGHHLRSWSARVSDLRNDTELGPFRLAFLESLLRIADWRGSSKETNDD